MLVFFCRRTATVRQERHRDVVVARVPLTFLPANVRVVLNFVP
jgi:hypothetical protein